MTEKAVEIDNSIRDGAFRINSDHFPKPVSETDISEFITRARGWFYHDLTEASRTGDNSRFAEARRRIETMERLVGR